MRGRVQREVSQFSPIVQDSIVPNFLSDAFNTYQFGGLIQMKPFNAIVLLVSISPFWWLTTCSASAQETSVQGTIQQLHRLTPQTATQLQRLLSYDGARLPIVSAHRGGAGVGLPENCIATFEATLGKTFSMLEIDPRLTKDGEVVVHHDATLERTTTGRGVVAEQTWEELAELRLKDTHGDMTAHSMHTLDQVIQWARGKTILVLDQKDTPLVTRIQKISEHQAENYVMLIVGSLEDIKTVYRTNPNIMMEVFVGDRKKFEQFDQAGVPWRNIIAFVGHTPPEDAELLRMIHAKGALCMAGTSRNIDRRFIEHPESGMAPLEADYRRLLDSGVDILETDIPREVGPLLYADELERWQLP